jgi:hypothetical protein
MSKEFVLLFILGGGVATLLLAFLLPLRFRDTILTYVSAGYVGIGVVLLFWASCLSASVLI